MDHPPNHSGPQAPSWTYLGERKPPAEVPPSYFHSGFRVSNPSDTRVSCIDQSLRLNPIERPQKIQDCPQAIPIDPTLLAHDQTASANFSESQNRSLLVSAPETNNLSTPTDLQGQGQAQSKRSTPAYQPLQPQQPQRSVALPQHSVSDSWTKAQSIPSIPEKPTQGDSNLRITFRITQGDHIHTEEATLSTPLRDIFERAFMGQYLNIKKLQPDILFADREMVNEREWKGYWFSEARASGMTVGQTEWKDHRVVDLVAGRTNDRGRRSARRRCCPA